MNQFGPQVAGESALKVGKTFLAITRLILQLEACFWAVCGVEWSSGLVSCVKLGLFVRVRFRG